MLAGHSTSIVHAVKELMENWIPHFGCATNEADAKNSRLWIVGKLSNEWIWPTLHVSIFFHPHLFTVKVKKSLVQFWWVWLN